MVALKAVSVKLDDDLLKLVPNVEVAEVSSNGHILIIRLLIWVASLYYM